jgi:hypothetical protein
LLTVGFVDLGAAQPPSQLAAHIVGAAPGDALVVLATGDLTGDGVADLLLGAPSSDAHGADGGGLYVVTGGATLTGAIDLSAPPATVYTIKPAAAGDQLGAVGTIGKIGTGSTIGLLVGAGRASPDGRTRAGSAYLRRGPISQDLDFSQPVGSAAGPSAAWHGQNAYDGLGNSVAIGNVTGTSENDVVIGAIQHERCPGIQSGAVLVWSGPIADGVHDLAKGATPTAVVHGPDQYDDCGSAVVLADVNGDSISDVILACSAGDGPDNTRTNAGEIHVLLGASALTGTVDLHTVPSWVLLYSPGENDIFGRHVTSLSAADIDGDGLADFCAGAHIGGDTPALNSPGRIDCYRSAP